MGPPRAAFSHSDGNPDDILKHKPSLLNRFYEPIILRKVLVDEYSVEERGYVTDLSSKLANSPEGNFHNFVNKMAQICDSGIGKDTITAFVILQRPSAQGTTLQYRFASNRRSVDDLIKTAEHVREILDLIGCGDGLSQLHDVLFSKIFGFARNAIEAHLEILGREAASCVVMCEADKTPGMGILIQDVSERAQACLTDLDDKKFVTKCHHLMELLLTIHESREDRARIEIRARDGGPEAEPWAEMLHAAGRLLSYHMAVKFLINMGHGFPELFHNFEVVFIASSRAWQNPLNHKDHSVERMMGRMPDDEASMTIFNANKDELESRDIDAKIYKVARNKSFRPIVHAEVLLDSSLERDKLTKTSDFYGSYRYIGCSKPTCSLCQLYFEAKGSPIKLRDGHKNLYPNWRVPDVLQRDGQDALRSQHRLMDKMLATLRPEAFRVMQEKISFKKRHDSNTYPTNPLSWGFPAASVREEDDGGASVMDRASAEHWGTNGYEHASVNGSDDEDVGGGTELKSGLGFS